MIDTDQLKRSIDLLALIPGEFRADYVEQPNFGGANDVITGWKGGRLVSIWELELGLDCVSKCGNYRLAAGYTFQAWSNMVQTDEWIRGVHTSNYIDMSDTSTFDGVVGRIEARF